jgi:hypothetical protein
MLTGSYLRLLVEKRTAAFRWASICSFLFCLSSNDEDVGGFRRVALSVKHSLRPRAGDLGGRGCEAFPSGRTTSP